MRSVMGYKVGQPPLPVCVTCTYISYIQSPSYMTSKVWVGAAEGAGHP